YWSLRRTNTEASPQRISSSWGLSTGAGAPDPGSSGCMRATETERRVGRKAPSRVWRTGRGGGCCALRRARRMRVTARDSAERFPGPPLARRGPGGPGNGAISLGGEGRSRRGRLGDPDAALARSEPLLPGLAERADAQGTQAGGVLVAEDQLVDRDGLGRELHAAHRVVAPLAPAGAGERAAVLVAARQVARLRRDRVGRRSDRLAVRLRGLAASGRGLRRVLGTLLTRLRQRRQRARRAAVPGHALHVAPRLAIGLPPRRPPAVPSPTDPCP